MAWIESYETSRGRAYRVVWRDPFGKKRSKSFTRKRDAQLFQSETERKERLGDLWEEPPVRFAEFWDGWIKRYEPTVRPSSYKRRIETVRHLGSFMPLELQGIAPSMVEDLVLAIAVDHPRQAEYVLQTIKMLLRAAAKRGHRINPAVLDVKAPRYEAPGKTFLTKAEVDRIADASSEPGLIRFAALTGLRWVEVSGLTDDDVLSDGRVVSVHRGITKTKAGVRQVHLSTEASDILVEQRLSRPGESTWLFPAPDGRRWAYHDFRRRVWMRATEATGFAGLTFHQMRHTFASLMIASGCHPGILKALMGHESIKTTIDIYGHLYPEAKGAAIAEFDAYLNRIQAPAAPSAPHERPNEPAGIQADQPTPEVEGRTVHPLPT